MENIELNENEAELLRLIRESSDPGEAFRIALSVIAEMTEKNKG